MLALPVFTFALAPLSAAYSRRHEFEADSSPREHASATALIAALIKLYEDNAATLTPDPLIRRSTTLTRLPPSVSRGCRRWLRPARA